MRAPSSSLSAVLFDLDGTFADTAPDLLRAVNVMRTRRRLAPVPLEATRPVTSTGARGLLRVAFDLSPDAPDYPAMREEFLELYAAALCVETRLFPGMAELIDELEQRDLRWGIVTNKAKWLTTPLIEGLQLAERCACIIGGDTTPYTKPHPEPLYAAARALGIEPQQAAYVGDDLRDVQAGRAAGMNTIAVRYGYLNGGIPDTWGADAVVDCPQDVLAHL